MNLLSSSCSLRSSDAGRRDLEALLQALIQYAPAPKSFSCIRLDNPQYKESPYPLLSFFKKEANTHGEQAHNVQTDLNYELSPHILIDM
eukprot:jgi/Botrbrau1/6212/Bobra.0109s0007.1